MEALLGDDPLNVLAYQYDIVCNGVELSSGAIRNHTPEVMYKAFDIAGYSANADIVLDRRDDVLAINEANLQFDAQQIFVEIEVAPQEFERRDIVTGLSDGINIEIVSGLQGSDVLKKLQ